MKDGEGELILSALGRLEDGQNETRKEIKDLTAKVERNITTTEVLKVRQDETRKDLDEHKTEHTESKKWFMGLIATAIIGAIGTLWTVLKSSLGMK